MAAEGSKSKYPLNDAVRGVAYSGLSIEETFTRIYSTAAWGKGSGAGSLPLHCLKWIEFVRSFIRREKVSSVVDLGCGDWQFSPYIYHDLGVKYLGYDVVKSVIDANVEQWGEQGYGFKQLDFSTRVDEIEEAELYILKDVLQHWSSARVVQFLRQLLSKQRLRHVLVCNCAAPADWPEDDIVDGGWRPLFASRPPLLHFAPEVLLRFPSLPNEKEVCLLRPAAPITRSLDVGADPEALLSSRSACARGSAGQPWQQCGYCSQRRSSWRSMPRRARARR